MLMLKKISLLPFYKVRKQKKISPNLFKSKSSTKHYGVDKEGGNKEGVRDPLFIVPFPGYLFGYRDYSGRSGRR